MFYALRRHYFSACWLFIVSFAITACSGRRPAEQPYILPDEAATASDSVAIPDPGMEIVASVPTASQARVLNYDDSRFVEPASSYDIQHTTLSLSFDFPGERVIGTALHRLTSTVQVLTNLRFDAKDMQINSVSVRRPGGEFEALAFQYNNNDLTMSLQPGLGQNVTLEVLIDYIAHPMRNGQKMGMVFVDGKGDDPTRPTQVWTLGQPEDNQFWFPTWDYPNDRMTFDLSLTVPQHFSTIANGDLVEQKTQPNNLRTDRWVLNKPHVAYLTGFAAGEYTAVVETYTRRDGSSVPLAYLVEPSFAEHASLIFGETPRVMRFMERNLGIVYPWSNYKQVCVREFTARGMENTTATVMYDKLQHDNRASLDFSGRDLITHELAHQWFGNMVAAKNWANLPINEGFASYFERLYLEQERSLAEAQKHTIDDRDRYLEQAKQLRRPIIWHGYTNPYEMYDQHTYEKAALVLHLLRHELGDEVWWRGVRQFITSNAYREVTIEALQRAMEQASGEGLGGFFQQWYRRPGHPELAIRHNYRADQGIYEVRVQQLQDSLQIGNFTFDADIEVNIPGAEPWLSKYRVTSRDTTFRFAIAGDVSFVRFDPGDWIPGDLKVVKARSEWLNQARYDDEPAGRYDAVQAMAEMETDINIRNVLLHVLQSDDAPFVREAAAKALQQYGAEAEVRPFLVNAINSDKNSAVRKEALIALAELQDQQLQSMLDVAIKDASYAVTAEAIRIYAETNPLQVVQAMRPLFDVRSWDNLVETAMIAAYAQTKAIEGIPYLQALLAPETNELVQVEALGALSEIAQYTPDVRSSVTGFMLGKLSHSLPSIRLAAVQALAPIYDDQVVASLNAHIPNESDERVKAAILSIVSIGN